MKTTSNQGLVSRRRRQAVLTSLGGLAVLAVGLAISLARPGLVLYAYGALVVGTVLSWIGVGLSDAWMRPPRPDRALAAALKGVGQAYALYHWVLPADHVLLAPWGLVVLAPFNQAGPVTVRGRQWREERTLAQRLLAMGRRPVRHPGRRLELDAAALAEAMATEDESLRDVPIESVAVFTFPSVVLRVEDEDMPVLRAADVRGWLRGGHPSRISPARRRRLEMALDAIASRRLSADSASRGARRGG